MQITFTEKAITTALEILSQYEPKPDGLRIKIIGGGCSGFQYDMQAEYATSVAPTDLTFTFGELKVFCDPMSIQYINGTEIDYAERDIGGGFTFNNPQVKKLCGCGQSFET